MPACHLSPPPLLPPLSCLPSSPALSLAPAPLLPPQPPAYSRLPPRRAVHFTRVRTHLVLKQHVCCRGCAAASVHLLKGCPVLTPWCTGPPWSTTDLVSRGKATCSAVGRWFPPNPFLPLPLASPARLFLPSAPPYAHPKHKRNPREGERSHS